MDTLVIKIPSKADLNWLLELTHKLGFQAYALSERESRLLARQKLAAIIEQVENQEEPSMAEINDIVQQVRTRRYAQAHQNSH